MSRDVDLYEASGGDGSTGGKPPAPDLAEFPPDVELLASIYDRLGELVRGQAALAGSKRRIRLRPWGRPETAADLFRARKARQNFEHIEQALVFVTDWTEPAEPARPPVTTSTTSTTRTPAPPPPG